MEYSSQNEQIKSNRFICNVFTSIIAIFCGIFLFLCGLDVIPLSLWDITLPSLFLSFGIIFVFTAFVQNNSVSLWMSFFFSLPALIILIVAYSKNLTYQNMYPFFVSIPAIASLFTMIYSHNFRIHIYAATFFGVLTAIFCLHSFGIIGLSTVIPCQIIFLGVVILLFTLKNKK